MKKFIFILFLLSFNIVQAGPHLDNPSIKIGEHVIVNISGDEGIAVGYNGYSESKDAWSVYVFLITTSIKLSPIYPTELTKIKKGSKSDLYTKVR